MIDDLSCGCFSHGAGNTDNFCNFLAAIFPSETAESFYGIVDLEDFSAGEFGNCRLADDRTDGTVGKSFVNIIVAVKILAGNSKETVACFNSSRIDAYARKLPIEIAGWLCVYYFCQARNRKIFHIRLP